MESVREPKPAIRDGEYVLKADAARGGVVTGTGPNPLAVAAGPDCLIPDTHSLAQRLLEQATVVHLQPDDVLLFSNVGDLNPEEINLDDLKDALEGRTLVFFHGPIELDQLRDLDGGCACCGHKTTGDTDA